MLAKGSDMIGRNAAYVDISCSEHGKFRTWQSEELGATIDILGDLKQRIDRGEIPKARLDECEKACGFTCNPFGLLADVNLRSHFDIPKVFRIDWMHSSLQQGFLTDEVYLYSEAAKRLLGITSENLETYLREDWEFPFAARSIGKIAYHVFDEIRQRSSVKAERLKASASELLGVYGLLRHWAATVVGERPELAQQRASFQSACTVVDIILLAKRGVLSTMEAQPRLHSAVDQWRAAHVAAYGTDHIKPKGHWLSDVADQIADCELVIDAFIIERLHLRVKRVAENNKELGPFEDNTLAGVIHRHFEDPKRPIGDCLVGSVSFSEGLLVADHLEIGGVRLARGDVVRCNGKLGIIQVCVEDDGVLGCIVKTFDFLRQLSTWGSSWRASDEVLVWPASHVEQAIWAGAGVGAVPGGHGDGAGRMGARR